MLGVDMSTNLAWTRVHDPAYFKLVALRAIVSEYI
jgi:hypothetical protein